VDKCLRQDSVGSARFHNALIKYVDELRLTSQGTTNRSMAAGEGRAHRTNKYKRRIDKRKALVIVSKRLEVPSQKSSISLVACEAEVGDSTFLVNSRDLPADESGTLLHLSREEAGWEWMSLAVRRLQPGDVFRTSTQKEEAAFVLLGGKCVVDWEAGAKQIGRRANVFEGLPYAVYLPAGHQISFTAETACEIAECRAPSEAQLEPRLITPDDVATNLRGGGNASRQIVEIIRPDFPADKLVVIEVYTPGGNWSSYPPHKHDVHNPPVEVDLDEIYYYRIEHPKEGFALQHLYSADKSREVTLRAHDGDAVLVHSGFHPVVAGPGYNVYYLNFLAGTSRTLAVTEDPNHVWIKSTWKETDPRLPLVR
jgi:5-deoxy-glucuronate isomerase